MVLYLSHTYLYKFANLACFNFSYKVSKFVYPMKIPSCYSCYSTISTYTRQRFKNCLNTHISMLKEKKYNTHVQPTHAPSRPTTNNKNKQPKYNQTLPTLPPATWLYTKGISPFPSSIVSSCCTLEIQLRLVFFRRWATMACELK